MLRYSCLLSIFLGGAALAGPSGTVRVIDGDTIDVGDTRVRLHAIDAPETDQMCGSSNSPAWACGDWVKSETVALFEGKTARCNTRDTDRYGRTVATCTVEGRDIGEVLVSNGLAFAYRRYGMEYDLAEKAAAVNARGLHATGVASPAAFRAAQRAAAQTGTGAQNEAADSNRVSDAPDPNCPIKGNISRHGGKRIYHMPGQEYYGQTRISLSKGERWFCSEAEARQAGWRRARK